MRSPAMRRSHIYIVRTWTEIRGENLVEIRGMVRDLQSGETRYFREWEALINFVNHHTEDPDSPVGKE